MSEIDNYYNSRFKRDLSILQNRLDLDPETYFDEDNWRIVCGEASEPYMIYDVKGNRVYNPETQNDSWQRDRPFWAIFDQADILRDEELIKAWKDACFDLSYDRDQWKSKMLNSVDLWEDQEKEKAEYRITWDKNTKGAPWDPGYRTRRQAELDLEYPED